MKTKTYLKFYFLLLSLLFLFLLVSCEDVEIEKLPNIDYNSITKEVNFTLSTDVKADITTLLDSNRAIKIPKEYYKVKEYDIDQSNTSIDNPITIGNHDSLLKYINSASNEEILTIYNEEYFTSHALAILPFKYYNGEFDKANSIKIYEIYGSIDNIYIIFDTKTEEKKSDELLTRFFFVEVDYSVIDTKQYTGYDIKITGDLIEKYLVNYMYIVTSDYSSNNYTTYKDLFSNKFFTFDFDLSKEYSIRLLKNINPIGKHDKYSAVIGKSSANVLLSALNSFQFIETNPISCDRYLYELKIDNTSYFIIDSQNFELWQDDNYLYTGKLIGGSFDYLNIFFTPNNKDLSYFIKQIYDVASTLMEHNAINIKTLNALFEFCYHINSWNPPEDFDQYTFFEQLDLIYRTDKSMPRSMRENLNNAMNLAKSVLSEYYGEEITIRKRYTINLEFDNPDLENTVFRVFENEYFKLPIPNTGNYGFCGWYLDGERIIDGTYTYDSDITVKAKLCSMTDFEIGSIENIVKSNPQYYFGITKYVGNDKEVTIPTHYKGHEIQAIGYNAFRGTPVEVLDLRCNVIFLDSFAVANASQLKKVYLGGNIKSFGYYAFKECTSLEEIIIEDGLTTLGYDTFHFCTALKSFTVGKDVKDLGLNIFEGCSNLEEFKVAEGNSKYKVVNNCLLSSSGSKLYYGCKTSTIPDNIVSIGDYAFYRRSDLKGTLVLPDSVAYIGQSAFSQTGLKEIYLPSGLKSIKRFAFYSTSGLKVYIDKNTDSNILQEQWDVGCTIIYTE